MKSTRKYPIVLESAGPKGLWMASVAGLPVFAIARGRAAALRQVRKTLEQHIAVLREHGSEPPLPATVVELRVAV